MNSMAWIGIILWGIVVTGFGLLSTITMPQVEGSIMAAQDVVFLVGGGILTCLIGVTGLIGFLGWIPKLRKEQKNMA